MTKFCHAMICSLTFAITFWTPFAVHSEDGQVSGIQVAVGSCIMSADKAQEKAERNAVIAAMTAAVISKGVNYIGKALTEAGATKTWTLVGSRNFQAASSEFPTCVQVIHGQFDRSGKSAASWAAPSGWPGDLAAQLKDRGIWLVTAPNFIFEGKIVPPQGGSAKDTSALTIKPVIASYANPIGTRFWRPGAERSVVLFFAITTPGNKPTLDTNPAATIVLGRMAPTSTYTFSQGSPKYSSPYESPWFSLATSDSVKPLTVTAMLSETQDQDDFLTFIGSVLSDPKVVSAGITEISGRVIPEVKEEAAADAATKATTATNDADQKLATALEKLKACADAKDPDALTAAANARIALRNYQQADKASPSPSGADIQSGINDISVRSSANTVKAQCNQLLGKWMSGAI